MRIQAIALVLAVLPAAVTAQVANINPSCRAEVIGNRLTTTVEYESGYTVIAPWTVVNQQVALNGKPGITLTATVDRVIEIDPATQARKATPFPSAVEVVFAAEDDAGILRAAAGVWCSTVARVRGSKAKKRAQKSDRRSG